MEMHFSAAEGRALHGLIEESSGDIVVRLDRAGFILRASENSAELGVDLSALLLKPHISDLAVPGHGADVERHARAVLAGEAVEGWIEFPVRICWTEDQHDCDADPLECLRWYAFSLKPIDDGNDPETAAIGLLRSVQQKHALQSEISARSLTDPLTGLANRHALCASLERALECGEERALAVFALDRLRAIFMQYGQRTTDEIQWGFARYLRTMVCTGQELAQIDAERFAVILPGMSMRQARRWAQDVLETFTGLTSTSSTRPPELTASAGLARVERSVDWTLRQAELGLVMARAGGGMRIGVSDRPARPTAEPSDIIRAIEEALLRSRR